MANRVILSSGSEPLATLLTSASSDSTTHDYSSAVAARAANAISSGYVHVEPGFLRGTFLDEVRACCMEFSQRRPLPPPLLHCVALVDALRKALALACGRPLLASAELTPVSYTHLTLPTTPYV